MFLFQVFRKRRSRLKHFKLFKLCSVRKSVNSDRRFNFEECHLVAFQNTTQMKLADFNSKLKNV